MKQNDNKLALRRIIRIVAIGFIPALIITGCAASAIPGSPPRLLIETSMSGRGWPFGESGRGSVILIEEIAREEEYGWTARKPVGLGGYYSEIPEETAFDRQQQYLNSLWGPEGKIIFYERIGTCCPFDLFGAPLDKGMLDVYALTWEGQAEPKHLYMDRFREGPILIPSGLTTKVKQLLALSVHDCNLKLP